MKVYAVIVHHGGCEECGDAHDRVDSIWTSGDKANERRKEFYDFDEAHQKIRHTMAWMHFDPKKDKDIVAHMNKEKELNFPLHFNGVTVEGFVVKEG